MATQSALYKAPFGPSGASEVDVQLAQKLLSLALSRGADYADLFFEYRAAGGFVYDEGILKSASRGVSMGLGVRAQMGDATGYAYTEKLDWDAMKRAAETAASIAQGGGAPAPQKVEPRILPSRYDLEKVTLDVPGIEKRKILERAAAAGHAFDKRVIKVECSFAEEIREIMVVTSEGKLARDTQPLMRFGIRVIAEQNGKRQEGSSGGGGRTTFAYFDGKSPEWHAKQAAEQAIRMLDAVEAPAGQMEVVLAPGDSGILLHEAVGHGLEADFNRKGTSNYAGQIGQLVASELCSVIDDATLLQSRGSINVDDEGNEPKSSMLIENGKLVGYLHDRFSAGHYKLAPSGNGRRESFACAPMPRMTNTILMAGPHDPEEIVKSMKKGIYAKKLRRRSGRHRERRLRLLAHRELPRRRRENHGSPQGRESDRQRSRRPPQGLDARQRRRDVGRHLDLRKRRSERAGRRGLSHDQDQLDHGRRHEDLRAPNLVSFVVVIGHGPDIDAPEGSASLLRTLGANVRTLELWDEGHELFSEPEGRARVIVIEAGERPDLAVAALRSVRKTEQPRRDAGHRRRRSAADRADRSFERLRRFRRHAVHPVELYARIRQLEWKKSEFATEERLKIGKLLVDRVGHEVTVEGRSIMLTAKEFALLAFLAQNRGRVFSRETLLARVWGARYEGGPRTVDIHVRRLRMKLGDTLPLETLRGAGYKMRVP